MALKITFFHIIWQFMYGEIESISKCGYPASDSVFVAFKKARMIC